MGVLGNAKSGKATTVFCFLHCYALLENEEKQKTIKQNKKKQKTRPNKSYNKSLYTLLFILLTNNIIQGTTWTSTSIPQKSLNFPCLPIPALGFYLVIFFCTVFTCKNSTKKIRSTKKINVKRTYGHRSKDKVKKGLPIPAFGLR